MSLSADLSVDSGYSNYSVSANSLLASQRHTWQRSWVDLHVDTMSDYTSVASVQTDHGSIASIPEYGDVSMDGGEY